MLQSVPVQRVDVARPTPRETRDSRDVPRRIGIANDYLRIPYANGSSFASQFLFRELNARGHEVTVIGPHDPSARADELPAAHVSFASLAMRNHPGLYIPLPNAAGLRAVEALGLDALIAQTGSAFMAIAPWLRLKRQVPALCVNTVHLPSVYDAALPASMHDNPRIQEFCQQTLVPWVMSHAVRVYNQTDGLVVLSRGLRELWRYHGVTVPIHVIPRSVDDSIFDGSAGEDPFDRRAARGGRLLVVCRHTREKDVARLLRIFAQHIATALPHSTLTLVGDGPDHDAFRDLAKHLGIADRTFFPGEFPVTAVRRFYRHADLFVYASLSETYGQVISEALWCGLPVLAFDDEKGVRDQIAHARTGMLIPPGPDQSGADHAFGDAARSLLQDRRRRLNMGEAAARDARERCSPSRHIDAWQDALRSAQEHCKRELPAARPLAALAPLAQWRVMHYLMAASGRLRAPPVINRHQRGQPAWAELKLSVEPV